MITSTRGLSPLKDALHFYKHARFFSVNRIKLMYQAVTLCMGFGLT